MLIKYSQLIVARSALVFVVSVGSLLIAEQVQANSLYRNGQEVLMAQNLVERTSAGVAVRREDNVANGTMATWAETNRNNNTLRMHTNTLTRVRLAGFTGSVSVLLLNANKRAIYATSPRTFGVDGCVIGRCKRDDVWTENLPASVIRNTKFISILHQHSPRWRLLDHGQKFITWLNTPEGKGTLAIIIAVAVAV
jgi:hypothetical protein